MNKLFRILAPSSALSLVIHIVLWISMIWLANIGFAYMTVDSLDYSLLYYGAHAFFVGGPFIVFVTFVTRYQIRFQKHLSLLSRKDGLTGLNNRRTFMELAQMRLDESVCGTLILLDADHFKRVNDVYGHAVGDVCLKEIAHRLKWNLREIDVAGRIGGEEFAVLFAGATIEQARVIAGRLGQPIPFCAEGVEAHLSITLSMGAVLIEPDVSLDAHLIRADQALYAAKEAGRARLVIWSEPSPPPTEDGLKKSAA
jgi:diguanylate cyclase